MHSVATAFRGKVRQSNHEIDHLLSSGIFGNSEHILESRWAMYDLLLHEIAKSDNGQPLQDLLARSPDQRRRLLDDPLLRIRLHEAYGVIRCGHSLAGTDFARLLQSNANHLATADSPFVINAFGHRGTIGDSNLLVLDGEGNGSSPLREEFLQLFGDEVLVNKLTGVKRSGGLCTPDVTQRNIIEEAFALLTELLPMTTRSAARHACMVALAEAYTEDAEMGSGTARSVPGLVFVSPREMRSPWTLAEALLHELTHCKLFDLYLGRRIFHPGYDVRNAITILSPWNVRTRYQSNEWPFDQALAAYHVYVHLAALANLLSSERSADLHYRFGQQSINESLRDASARARYLGSQLIRHSAKHLSEDGQSLVTWLAEVLDVIDPEGAQASQIKYFAPLSEQFVVCPYTSSQSGWDDITVVLRQKPKELLLLDALPFHILACLQRREAAWKEIRPNDIPSSVALGEVLAAVDQLKSLHLIADG